MFEAHVLRYTGPFLRLLAKVLGFRGLLCVLASGWRFSQPRFRVIRDNFGFPSLFHVLDSGFRVLRFSVSGFRGSGF